jgi:acyl-CoA reductase-like NAD-dependent aldehyde dehydrogenase
MEVINPAIGQIIALVPECGSAGVDKAVETAVQTGRGRGKPTHYTSEEVM